MLDYFNCKRNKQDMWNIIYHLHKKTTFNFHEYITIYDSLFNGISDNTYRSH